MPRFMVVSCALLTVCVVARPNAPAEAQPGGAAYKGPFADLLARLSDEQKQQLASIVKDASTSKADMKQKIVDFIKTLPADVQQIAKQEQEKFENIKRDWEAKVNALGGDAKALFDRIKAVDDNENLTQQQEMELIKKMVDGNQVAVDQMRSVGIPFPDLDKVQSQ